MTPQNEAQMNDEFNKFVGDAKYISGKDNLTHLYMTFKAAYYLQQEKIDKLKEENKSLRSDLDTATTEAIAWLELVPTEGCCSGRECGCLGKPINREYYDLQNMKEIREKFKLDGEE